MKFENIANFKKSIFTCIINITKIIILNNINFSVSFQMLWKFKPQPNYKQLEKEQKIKGKVILFVFSKAIVFEDKTAAL